MAHVRSWRQTACTSQSVQSRTKRLSSHGPTTISHFSASSQVTWAQWSNTCTVQSLMPSMRNCWPAIWPECRTIVWPVMFIAVNMRFCSAVRGILRRAPPRRRARPQRW